MEQALRISIITAVRNGETSIASTVRSVREQAYPHIQYVVIDGASTDRTLQVVGAQARKPDILVSESDSGVYDAFNKGLRHARGDIVGYLNSGDVYTSAGVIQAIADEFAADPGADVVFADVLVVDLANGTLVRVYRADDFSPSRIGGGFMPGHPSIFIRRSAYEAYGGYDPSYKIAGDFELVARYLGRHRLRYRYLNRSVVRMPMGGLSTRGLRSNLVITQEMHRACHTNGISTGWLRLCLRWPVKAVRMSARRPAAAVPEVRTDNRQVDLGR